MQDVGAAARALPQPETQTHRATARGQTAAFRTRRLPYAAQPQPIGPGHLHRRDQNFHEWRAYLYAGTVRVRTFLKSSKEAVNFSFNLLSKKKKYGDS